MFLEENAAYASLQVSSLDLLKEVPQQCFLYELQLYKFLIYSVYIMYDTSNGVSNLF